MGEWFRDCTQDATAGSSYLCFCGPSILAPWLESLLDGGALFGSVGILHCEKNSFPATPGVPESGTVGRPPQSPQLPCWEASMLSVQLINTAQWKGLPSINHNSQRIQRLKQQYLHLFSTYYVLGICMETSTLPPNLKKCSFETIRYMLLAFEKPT